MEEQSQSISIDQDPSIKRLENLADILDNRFKIPGTKVQFGLDGIIGLIPYAGDVFTFLVSGYLLFLIAKKGAGTKIIVKMIWYVWIDSAIGTIPFVGDIFDIRYRANIKNIKLMQGFINEGKHSGSALGILIFIIIILFILIGLSIWLIREVFYWIIT